jgi:hypothetical protein
MPKNAKPIRQIKLFGTNHRDTTFLQGGALYFRYPGLLVTILDAETEGFEPSKAF